jgi:hypothetical protein
MSRGISVISGSSSIVHEFRDNGKARLSGSFEVTGSTGFKGNVRPDIDNQYILGEENVRWQDGHFVQTTIGALFEEGLRTDGVGKYPTGTVVVWKNGELKPCTKKEDNMVQGILKHGKDQPIILGAEPVLLTGKVKCNDYIVTSTKEGHGESAKKNFLFFFKRNMFGKVIAQALEDGDGDSYLLKCMIRKM